MKGRAESFNAAMAATIFIWEMARGRIERKKRRCHWNHKETCGDQKFRVKPFLKGLREWRGQSPFPGAHFPYFRSRPQLLYL